MTTLTEAHNHAIEAAKKATNNFINERGEPFYCGFAWVEIPVTRTNSKEAKELLACGFTKSYMPRLLMFWNPSGHPTQSMEAKEVGAVAYRKAFNEMLPDVKIRVRNRAD